MPAAPEVIHALQAIPSKTMASRYVPQVNIAVLGDEDYFSKGQPSVLSCGFLLNAAVALCKIPPSNALDLTAGATPASGLIKVVQSKNPPRIWIEQIKERTLLSWIPVTRHPKSFLTRSIRIYIRALNNIYIFNKTNLFLLNVIFCEQKNKTPRILVHRVFLF